MQTVTIVDYGMCNLNSVARAIQECGANSVVSDNPEDLQTATHIILPGVGAFPDAMQNIRDRALDEALYEQVVRVGIPFLGICLGMQLIASKGYEVSETKGLGWISGEVRQMQPTNGERIPHVGWNEVYPVGDCPLLKEVEPGRDFYFVHSYHFCCEDESNVMARTPYCGEFTSIVGKDNIFGTQFHPEKSQRMGFQVLRNFLSL